MSSFTKPLTVTKIGTRLWRVERQFTYFVGEEDSNEWITVPRGFKTDLTSIPKIFWTIMGHPAGKYVQSAVLHDYMYFNAVYIRKRCDEIFEESMRVLKVFWLQRKIMYLAVRMWGWIGWRRHREIE